MTAAEAPTFDPRSLIAEPGFAPRIVEGMDEEAYHADRSAVGSTSLRLLVPPDGSAKQFYWSYFLGKGKKVSDEMKFGRVIHMAVLEGPKFRERYKVMPEFSGLTKDGRESKRSKDAKEKEAAWILEQAPGTIICSTEDIECITGIIESIQDHPQASKLLRNGRPEVSGYYVDPETQIKLKFRADFLTFNGDSMTDLKSAKASANWSFGESCFNYRYDIQLFMYLKGVEAVTGKRPKLVSVIAAEKEAPYEVGTYYFTPDDLGQAEFDYHMALRKLRKCIDENHWPQRQQTIERIHTPYWFINQSVNGVN